MEKKLTNLSYIRFITEKYGFSFTKSLGQNFLVNSAIPKKIAENAEISNELVLEIGPGIGCLTEQLCLRAKKVVAVEIDKKLIPLLEETLEDFQNLEIINDDILNVDIPKICRENGAETVAVVANLPYYITTPIVMNLLEKTRVVKSVTVMVQKELAKRFCADANTPEYGAATAAIKYYSNPKYLFSVSAGSFFPKPKVDSAVLKLEIIPENERIFVKNKEIFFRVITAAFAMRRKTLVNNLAKEFEIEKLLAAEILKKAGLSEQIRGETLTIENYAKIADLIDEIN